jgi:predicted neutral ceramidase superfamily lipid hydrolase
MWKAIFKTTLLAGSLDIVAACMSAYITNKVPPAGVLKYIASGVFGKEAFAGGYGMMAWGLLFHFMIAFACTAAFFALYPKIKILRSSYLLNAFLIAAVAWAVTSLVIIPLSNIPAAQKFTVTGVIRACLILVVCIGLPVSLMTRHYYTSQQGPAAGKAVKT